MADGCFSILPDDVVLEILYKLDNNPRSWPVLACVSTRFSSLIRTVCFKTKCVQLIPAVDSACTGSSWESLYKLCFCCPGLFHSGVHLERDIISSDTASANSFYFDYETTNSKKLDRFKISDCTVGRQPHFCSSVTDCNSISNNLLADRFQGDELYICGMPGCVHVEEEENSHRRWYMLFRGIFVNFKQSRVWREGERRKIDLNCAFCESKSMWDLHSSLCFYGDGKDNWPLVRAYVCENEHVSGAWFDWPPYNIC